MTVSKLLGSLVVSMQVFSGPALADPLDPFLANGQPPVVIYGVKEGLPSQSVRCLAFDTTGFLWVGTDRGAARFNGRQWTTIGLPEGTSSHVTALLAFNDGSVWLGLRGGEIARWHGGELRHIATAPGAVQAFMAPNNTPDDIWVATDNGLRHLVMGRWGQFPADPFVASSRVTSLAQVRNRSGDLELWAGTEHGLALVSNEGVSNRIRFSNDPQHTFVVAAVASVSGDSLWAATTDSLYRIRDASIVERVPFPRGGVRNVYETLDARGAGVLWVASVEGLARYQGGSGRLLREPAAHLIPGPILAGGGHRNQLLWVAMQGGVARIRLGGWERLGGLTRPVWSVYQESSAAGGRLWVGTDVISRLGAQGLEPVPLPAPRTTGILAIAEGSDDTLPSTIWIGTNNVGLFRLTHGTFERVALPALHNRVAALAPGRNRDGKPCMWVGTSRGLGRVEHGRWIAEPLPVSKAHIWALLWDNERATLWVGTDRGLFRVGAARETTQEGRGTDLDGVDVRALHLRGGHDSGHQLWVGTSSSGVTVLDPTMDPSAPLFSLSTASTPALPSNDVTRILSDGKGRVYISGRVVTRITLGPGSIPDAALETFTDEDGLGAIDMTSAGFQDAFGRIWIGSFGGLAVLDPATEIPDRNAKPLVLEAVRIHGRPVETGPLPVLPYHENTLEFEYALPSLFRTGETQYRTQLTGVDATPRWSTDGRRTYTNLDPGNYTFEIVGRDSRGHESSPLRVTFRIRPAPWRTWWAYACYATLLVWAGVLLQRRKMQRLLALEQLRTRIALDLHDDLGATLTVISMNAHNLMPYLAGRAEPIRTLAAISSAAGEAIQGMREVVWSLDPIHDQLQDVAMRMRSVGGDICGAARVAFLLEASGTDDTKVGSDQRRELLRIFKEAVNNAVRHGRPRHVRVRIIRDRDTLILQVTDDGAGFDVRETAPGNGLRSLEARARRLGGAMTLRSSVGSGTTLSVALPLPRALLWRRGA
jgi:ligand-binding sensor domain-containing protein/two-component sensor histidine kinase